MAQYGVDQPLSPDSLPVLLDCHPDAAAFCLDRGQDAHQARRLSEFGLALCSRTWPRDLAWTAAADAGHRCRLVAERRANS